MCPSPAGCADLNSLDSLSPQEKKRQGYIHELIETEERYVEDLQIVLEVMDTVKRPSLITYLITICHENKMSFSFCNIISVFVCV